MRVLNADDLQSQTVSDDKPLRDWNHVFPSR